MARKSILSRLNIAQQGVILVVGLLLCEFLFVGTLSAMLAQAEEEARRQDFAREVTARASRLLLVIYDTGDAVGKFASTRALGSTERYKAGLEEIPEIIGYLKENLKGQAEPERLLANIEKNLDVCMPVIESIKRDAEHLSKKEAARIWSQRRLPIQGNVDRLVDDLEALIDYSRAIENQAPERERQQRGITRGVLLFGLATNIVFFVMTILFFTRRITRRLDVIGDNVKRLETGGELNPLLTGSDEIAEVDRVFHDTAAAVRREEALLKESESRLRTILESVPIGVAVLDEGGRIEFVNSAVQKTFGYDPAELRGINISALVAADKSVDLTSSSITEITARRKDGSNFPADFSISEVNIADAPKRIAMILDATERYELKNLRLSFVNMIREELRAPLTLLDTFFSNYRSQAYGGITDDARQRSGKAQQNIRRLLILLNDLFDLERLESGKIEIAPSDCHVASILERSLDAVSSLADKRKVALEVATADFPPGLQVYADADRIVQVLVNFLSNAVKFSPENSKVSLAVDSADGAVQFAVIDRGRGIPAEKMGSLFQQFQQVEAKDGTDKGGTGLGLAICKAIVEEHGGQVGVESKEGEGSKFWLRIPQARASSAASVDSKVGEKQ